MVAPPIIGGLASATNPPTIVSGCYDQPPSLNHINIIVAVINKTNYRFCVNSKPGVLIH